MAETLDFAVEDAPVAPPKKNKGGRPRKHPLPPVAPPVDLPDFVIESGTAVSAVADMETQIEGKNGVEMAPEDGFGLARAVGENPNDLVLDEIELENPGVEFAIEHARHEETPAEEEPMPSGDVKIPLLVRELYVEALRDEAENQGITFTHYVQRLLDWWVENEFCAIKTGGH